MVSSLSALVHGAFFSNYGWAFVVQRKFFRCWGRLFSFYREQVLVVRAASKVACMIASTVAKLGRLFTDFWAVTGFVIARAFYASEWVFAFGRAVSKTLTDEALGWPYYAKCFYSYFYTVTINRKFRRFLWLDRLVL